MDDLQVTTVEAWREWLVAHHAASDGVWLVFHRRDTGLPTLEYDDAVCEALCFGWIDGTIRKLTEERYARRFTPRRPGSNWSPLNRERVARMESEGRMAPAGRAVVEAARADGSWAAPDRPELPDEPTPDFQAALDASPAARAFFESLAPSYRKQYVAWVAVARRPETRERRIAESIELLTKGEKLGMR
jgi:uncharacterized protein YdeI (YjbR/CyaY-like superfamily)